MMPPQGSLLGPLCSPLPQLGPGHRGLTSVISQPHGLVVKVTSLPYSPGGNQGFKAYEKVKISEPAPGHTSVGVLSPTPWSPVRCPLF